MNDIKKTYFTLPKYISPTLILIFLGLFFRLLVINISNNNLNDLEVFKEISQLLVSGSLKDFYYTNNNATSYSPIILYFLYIIEQIMSLFNISFVLQHNLTNYFVKLSTILFDAATIIIIFKISLKRFDANKSFLIGLFYALNPAIILISTTQGQIESIYTFLVVLSIYFLNEVTLTKKLIGFAFYVLAILTMPYLVILFPIFCSFIVTILSENYNIKNKLFFIFSTLALPILFIIVWMPFMNGIDLDLVRDWIISPFMSTNYATFYAYNFQALIGGNYIPSFSPSPLYFSFWTVGFILFLYVLICSILFLKRYKNSSYVYFFCVAFLNAGFFIFATGIRERYLYLTVVFLLLSYVYSNSKEVLIIFFGFTFTLFINCSDVLRMYVLDNNKEVLIYGMAIIPFINFILFFNMITINFNKSEDSITSILKNENKFKINFKTPSSPLKISKFNLLDLLLISTITILYSVVALYNIGNNNNPQTTFIGYENDIVYVEFDEVKTIKKISTLLGTRNNKDVTFSYTDSNTEEKETLDVNYKSVFKWEIKPIEIVSDKIAIKFNTNETMIQELAFLDSQDNVIKPTKIYQNVKTNSNKRDDLSDTFTYDANGLFDESNLVQTTYNFKNSTYFDEIYHPRTGYEFVNNLKVYEYTHPPLGKVFMAFFIKYLGMNPFAYRLPGIIVGIIMVPLMYLFGKQLLKNSYWAFFVSTIFAFDFMHFTQTRIATIDSYITLFVIGMYYFMYKFYRENYFSLPIKKTLSTLFFSGLFMGLGIASKWTGIYAGLGLAILFLLKTFESYKEYLYVKEYWEEKTVNKIYPFFSINIKIVVCCIFFFIVFPILIYILSYIPYMHTPSMTDGLSGIWRNQQNMLNYHGGLKSTHPFMSSWWTWPLIVRPIYYYSNLLENTVAGISAFGNPALWWTGILALFYCFNKINSDNKKDAWFLIISYFAQYLPWIFVSRTTYIYHYFPSTPFVALMVGFMFKDVFKTFKNFWVILYLLLVVALFVLFYPVLSGMPVPDWYPSIFLKWFDTWVLVPKR